MTFAKVFYKTVHKANLSMEQLAERLCMGQQWSLYKMADPTNSNYKFPAELLISLMQITKDFSLLHYIAQQCGFVCVRYSRFALSKKPDMARLSELFGHASAAINKMYESGEIDKAGYEFVYNLLREIAGHLKAADKIKSGQQELKL